MCGLLGHVELNTKIKFTRMTSVNAILIQSHLRHHQHEGAGEKGNKGQDDDSNSRMQADIDYTVVCPM